MIGVYGTTYRTEKAGFWEWLTSHLRPSTIPWLCVGDINKFFWHSEKSSGSTVLYNRPQYLVDFMNSMKQINLDFNGPAFT